MHATLEGRRGQQHDTAKSEPQPSPGPARILDERTTLRAEDSPPETMPTSQRAASFRPITTYTFDAQALFSVATAPMRATDLVLERGETLLSQPTAGDAARWVITVLPGNGQSHVFVKPLRPGLRTNLTLTTNRRTYFIELTSRDDGSYMAGVEWRYPVDEAAERRNAIMRAERERQAATSVSNLQSLSFDYQVRVVDGSPDWTPTMVFDDGEKTFIRFPRAVAAKNPPLLFVLRSGGVKSATYVNYRIKGDLYVLDRRIEMAELRLADGNNGQDVVRITRRHPL